LVSYAHVKQHKCKCKIKYIYMVLHGCVKQCKCKTNTFIWFCTIVWNNANWCLWKKNQMLIGLVFFILIDAHLPKSFWGKSLLTSSYFQNRILPKAFKNKTPFEMWFGITPNLFYWRVLKCHTYTHIHHKNNIHTFYSHGCKHIMYMHKNYFVNVGCK
jgi:hypothetical protein